jgi:hypothetical protein
MLGIAHASRRASRTLIVVFGLTVAVLPLGCGGSETVEIAVKEETPAIKLLETGRTSASLDAALERLSATSSADDASRGFDDLSRQDDALGDALTTALCTGMEQLGDAGDDATGTNWQDFLVGQLEAQLPSVPQPEILSKVNGIMETWDLAQVNGGLARTYYHGCVAG